MPQEENNLILHVKAIDDETGDILALMGAESGEMAMAIYDAEEEECGAIHLSRDDVKMLTRQLLEFLRATELSH